MKETHIFLKSDATIEADTKKGTLQAELARMELENPGARITWENVVPCTAFQNTLFTYNPNRELDYVGKDFFTNQSKYRPR